MCTIDLNYPMIFGTFFELFVAENLCQAFLGQPVLKICYTDISKFLQK